MAVEKSETSGSVRIGPVTVISLVVILCLAVLSVLAVTTARASNAEADRQREFISSTYANDFEAQQFLADVDNALLKAQKAGATADGAMKYVRKAVPDVAAIDGRNVHVAFLTELGRRLTVELRINDDLTYAVTKWAATTDWTEEEETNLWTGE